LEAFGGMGVYKGKRDSNKKEKETAMAKKPFPVDKDKLIQAIAIAEKDGPLGNQSMLNQAVADIYNERFDPEKELTKGVVYLRIRDWNLEVQTKPGKRGRTKMTDEHKAKLHAARKAGRSRSEKIRRDPKKQEVIKNLREDVPKRFLPLVERIARGSKVAAVKLNCLQCVGYETAAVKECTAMACAMWLFRPYQGKLSDEDALEIAQSQSPDIPALEV
jgi:hypothetical protein